MKHKMEGNMTNMGWWKSFILAVCLLGTVAISGRTAFGTSEDDSLHIDIPTQLGSANVVIDFGHLVLNGDMPFALGDIHLLADDLSQWRAKGQVVVIFHGDAAFLVLNDTSYDTVRHASAGNPYKGLFNELMNEGVQLELCGATAKANHWGNANLVPGVKVNTNAMVRVTELEQKGYTLIYQ
jgi:intracellular sulfur oxidation DsrE/DsrF family protein